MVSHPTVFKFHVRVSECAMLGDTPSHAHAPHPEGALRELLAHESNDIRLRQAHTFLDGLKGGSVFPCHLNHSRHITRRETRQLQNDMPNWKTEFGTLGIKGTGSGLNLNRPMASAKDCTSGEAKSAKSARVKLFKVFITTCSSANS